MLPYDPLVSRQSRPHFLLERDSPRDQLVVTLFLLTVFGLLLGAGIKSRMIKAGFNANNISQPWNVGRRWWEAWMPRQQTGYELGVSRFGYSPDRDVRMEEYLPVGDRETPRPRP
ncbi:hypothetical protein H0H93_002943 [Arthromyces matolae]|nr:hypothetical protein H0H93_002943 [Arthromyces matolae]